MKTLTMVGESSFSNDIVEWHNQKLLEAFCKNLSDVSCEPKVALALERSAKKSLLI